MMPHDRVNRLFDTLNFHKANRALWLYSNCGAERVEDLDRDGRHRAVELLERMLEERRSWDQIEGNGTASKSAEPTSEPELKPEEEAELQAFEAKNRAELEAFEREAERERLAAEARKP